MARGRCGFHDFHYHGLYHFRKPADDGRGRDGPRRKFRSHLFCRCIGLLSHGRLRKLACGSCTGHGLKRFFHVHHCCRNGLLLERGFRCRFYSRRVVRRDECDPAKRLDSWKHSYEPADRNGSRGWIIYRNDWTPKRRDYRRPSLYVIDTWGINNGRYNFGSIRLSAYHGALN